MTGFVYFLRCETGELKIGWSGQYKIRLRTIQGSSPHLISEIAKFPAPRFAERILLRKFAPHCIHHEWFKPHEDILRLIVEAEDNEALPDWVIRPTKFEPTDKPKFDMADIVHIVGETILPGADWLQQAVEASAFLGISTADGMRSWKGQGNTNLRASLVAKFNERMPIWFSRCG